MNPDLVPCLIIIVAVTGAGWLAATLMPPTLQFGVRLPPDHTGEPIIGELRRIYRAGLLLGTLLAAAVTLAVSLTAPVGVIVVVAPVMSLIFTVGTYYLVHARLARAKTAGDWYAGQHIGAAAALPVHRSRRWLVWVVLAAAITAATAIIGALDYSSMPARLPMHFALDGTPNRFVDKSVLSVFWPVVVQAFLTGLLSAIVWSVEGSRFEVDPAAPAASFERQRRFRDAMSGALGTLIVALATAFLLTSLATWGVITNSRAVIPAAVLVLAIVPALAVVVMAARMGAQGWRLGPQRTTVMAEASGAALVQRDDDQYWKGGLIYFNPDDPAYFVSKRFGVGWTMNFAHPVAWLFLLAPLAIVGLSIFASRA